MKHLSWLAVWVAGLGHCASAFQGSSGFTALDPDQRAAAVEAEMTDAERFQLLYSVITLPLPGIAAPPANVKPTAGYVPGIPRLGIPDILETDASLGVTNPLQLRAHDVATAMPSNLALASSFDLTLARTQGATIGAEARAKGFNVLLGGGVNLTRDPRNGRNFEYLGEDPWVAGTLAGAVISGTQSQGVVSTVKHFALNDQETQRHSLDARIDEAQLRESDLLAFELAIERGQPGSVMCSYNQVNGESACGNPWLLNQVLKSDWRYRGWVMSDWGAVGNASYFSRGLDQQSGAQLDAKVWFDAPLKQELAAGRITRTQVSAAVRRILRSIYLAGADREAAEAVIDYPAHAQIAQQVAEEGIILLKNGGVLPLVGARRVLVVGGHADIGVLSGGGSSQVIPYGEAPTFIPVGGPGVAGLFSRQLYMPSAPLAALKAALPGSVVEFESGYDVDSAAAAAARSDVTIVFATQWEQEGFDHASMSLPEGQDTLITGVARANPNTVVVLETGNPVKMPWLSSVAAVLESWYPGQMGGIAIAEVLSGKLNPSGHLPITFPKNEAQLARRSIPGLGLPEHTDTIVDYGEGTLVGYRWFSARQLEPLFPFGHGLSYTQFTLSTLELRAEPVLTASFTVHNVGRFPGTAVPQLYLTSAAGRPLQRLVAFSRLTLAPGESREAKVILDSRMLAHWDTPSHCWRIEHGTYTFALGSSAMDLGPTANLRLAARMIVYQ